MPHPGPETKDMRMPNDEVVTFTWDDMDGRWYADSNTRYVYVSSMNWTYSEMGASPSYSDFYISADSANPFDAAYITSAWEPEGWSDVVAGPPDGAPEVKTMHHCIDGPCTFTWQAGGYWEGDAGPSYQIISTGTLWRLETDTNDAKREFNLGSDELNPFSTTAVVAVWEQEGWSLEQIFKPIIVMVN